jgi:hypothetical protein
MKSPVSHTTHQIDIDFWVTKRPSSYRTCALPRAHFRGSAESSLTQKEWIIKVNKEIKTGGGGNRRVDGKYMVSDKKK